MACPGRPLAQGQLNGLADWPTVDHENDWVPRFEACLLSLTRPGSEAKSAARRDSDGTEVQPRFSSSALALLGPDPHQAAPVQGSDPCRGLFTGVRRLQSER